MSRRELFTGRDVTGEAAPMSGIRWDIEEGENGETHFHAVQDPTAILEANKNDRLTNDGYSPSREMRRVARIPMGLIAEWLFQEGWNPFDKANGTKLMRKLNDIDYALLRTAEGRLGPINGGGGFR